MSKLDDLHRFIVELNYVAAEKINSIQDEVAVIATCRPATVNTIVIAEKHYKGVLTIDDFPHQSISEDELFAQISTWLCDVDTHRREIAKIILRLGEVSNDRADLEIEIDFEDFIEAIEDPTGSITFNNKTYRRLT